MTFHAQMASSLGQILLCADATHLNGLYFVGQKDSPPLAGLPKPTSRNSDPTQGMMGGIPLKGVRVRRREAAGGELFAPEDLHQPAVASHDADSALSLGPLVFMQDDTPASARRVLQLAHDELAEYFQGERRQFTVPLALEGTAFQKKVWQALLAIPYGQIVSYADVAAAAGLGAGHGRPVGTAVGRNPITIMVPCHRVLSSSGRLNGYTGGLERKYALLQREGLLLG